MSFYLGDVMIDRLQLGYGATESTALYVLTQLSNATIDITADFSDIKDKDGRLLYRKYTGKSGEVTATNTFMNFSILETVSGAEAEIASNTKPIITPVIKIVNAGETLDITDAVEDSFIVNALSAKGSLGKAYSKGSAASATEFKIETGSTNKLTPPTDTNETRYLVKFKKSVKAGTKIGISNNKYPKVHELYFKALAVDKCSLNTFRACIIHIASFMPSPEVSIAIQSGDSQTMDYKGTILTNACLASQNMVEVYFIDEEEEDIEI